MKKAKTTILISAVLALAMSLSACGKEPEQSVNYEQPVRTLAQTMQAYDEHGYLDCFTAAAKQEFMSRKDYNEDFIQLLYPESSGGQKLSISIVSHKELDDSEIEELEKEYVKTFSRRIKITKAERLEVHFKLYQKNLKRSDTKEITVVRSNNTWYIFGSVIDDFDFRSDTGIFSDIIKSTSDDDD